MIRVDQLMTHPVVTCRTGDNLNTVASLMWDHDCGVVPVVDDKGQLAGIVTDRDVCMAAYTQGRRLCEVPVDTAMTRAVVSVRPDDDLARAEALMEAHQVRRLPVVNGEGHPVGLLSLNDLARDAGRAGASQLGMLSGFARTLAAICRPRSTKPTEPRLPRGWEDYVQRPAS
jgi:CBS domain-containing protein